MGIKTIFNFKKKGILGICVMSSFIYCKLPHRFIKKGAPYWIGIYILDSSNTKLLDTISYCTSDIGSLFLKTINTNDTLYFGVNFRPPNGNRDAFITKLEHILTTLPDKGVCIMGDFNIDLLESKPKIMSDFEDCILRNGYSPVISIATHKRSNCKKSCIDNILTDNIEKTILSGTLIGTLIETTGHHSMVFEICETA